MNQENTVNHALIWRIILWEYNRNMDETLTEELFIREFGGCSGSHFYSKWKHYGCNFMQMAAYFGRDTGNGQKFCNMVMEQMSKYEQREKAI